MNSNTVPTCLLLFWTENTFRGKSFGNTCKNANCNNECIWPFFVNICLFKIKSLTNYFHICMYMKGLPKKLHMNMVYTMYAYMCQFVMLHVARTPIFLWYGCTKSRDCLFTVTLQKFTLNAKLQTFIKHFKNIFLGNICHKNVFKLFLKRFN